MRLLAWTGVTQWYSDTAHAVTHLNGDRRAWYDQNGNMTQRVEVSGSQRITYTQEWDVENKLVAVTNTVTGQVTRFYRDADGNLVKKSDGAGTVMIVNGLYEEAGGVATSYYTFGGQRVAMRTSGAVYWLHGDHLGSASLTTNAGGQKVAELRYLPFGETRWVWGVTPTDRRYTGQREVAGVGLYDYNARMYWPVAGRFVSADTLVPEPGNPQGLNQYAYVLSNPLRYVDDDGHLPIVPLLIVGGVIGLKAVDYGWTAWDSYQSLRVLNDPNAEQAAKVQAAADLALSAALEVSEPDDLLPVALPVDDLARKGAVAGLREAMRQGGLKAGVRVIRETMGDAAPQVIRHLYDQGLFRGIRSYREWDGILQGVRQGAGLEVHHLIEQRFAQRLGLEPGDIPSIILTQEEHLRFTSAWRQRIGYSGDPTSITTANATIQDIWAAAQRIYANYPDLLEAVRQALFGQ